MHRRSLSDLLNAYELSPHTKESCLSRPFFIFCCFLTLSPSPSFSSVLQPFALSPVPCETPEPSPTVLTAARSPSASLWSLWLITLGAEESYIWLDTTVHLIHVP